MDYFMENEGENLRLDRKTNPKIVEKQAAWAHIVPGMRVADLGCGSGKTTSVLCNLVQSGGRAVGVDISQSRVEFAQSHYAGDRIDFILGDIRKPLDDLGQFDFIWIRFVLEYYRKNALEILKNVTQILKPGGTLCIIDLDYNCLNHFPLPAKLEKTLFDFMRTLEERVNFDPYAGRKLYSHLWELRYENLNVHVGGHHVIYGELEDADAYNWVTKVKVASAKIGFDFEEYPGGADEFMEEFHKFFNDPGRFTYTPVICARGTKPMEG